MTLRNSLPKRYPLRTRPYRIRSILDVRSINIFVVVREDRCADAELRVGTISRCFGRDATGMKARELRRRYGIRFADFGYLGGIARL
jgi:hypothetical protein